MKNAPCIGVSESKNGPFIGSQGKKDCPLLDWSGRCRRFLVMMVGEMKTVPYLSDQWDNHCPLSWWSMRGTAYAFYIGIIGKMRRNALCPGLPDLAVK